MSVAADIDGTMSVAADIDGTMSVAADIDGTVSVATDIDGTMSVAADIDGTMSVAADVDCGVLSCRWWNEWKCRNAGTTLQLFASSHCQLQVGFCSWRLL